MITQRLLKIVTAISGSSDRMQNKKIVILFERSPFVDIKTYEGLRMGLGLTISNDDVSFVFTGHSVNILRKVRSSDGGLPDVKKALSMLAELKKKIYVLTSNNTSFEPYPVKFIDKNFLFKLIEECDILIRC